VPRRTELSHEQQVEGSAERLRDLERDRHAAARQGEHDDVVAPEASEAPRELATRVAAVLEHARPPARAIVHRPCRLDIGLGARDPPGGDFGGLA
jgi:hypothetical protein